MRSPFGVILALALPATALGQDQEYFEPEVDRSADEVETHFELESEYHSFDNLDFRPLDESSDQAILDSDDRNTFAYTGVMASAIVPIASDLKLTAAASHRGLWGNDQIGNTNAFGGFVYVSALSMEWTPITSEFDGSPDEKNPLMLRVGRQYYRIGGIGGADYAFEDVIDGVRLDIPLGTAGHLEVLPLSVASSSGNPQDANFISYVGQSTTQTFGFRGDHMTRRHGGTLVLDGFAEGLDTRVYGFYSDLGALGSGSDISYNGELGNFSDNDWVANFGVRTGYETGPVSLWALLDGSRGIDRKELVAADVNTNGFAWGGGVALDLAPDDAGVVIVADYFEAQGAVYTDDGMLWSHGYVSMKGRHTGGLIVNRFLGWHPSAYVGMFGVENDPHDPDRKSGTRAIHLGADLALMGPVRVSVDGWTFADTGTSYVDFDKLDTLVPPYGYSRSQFAAEQRHGLSLGQEINAEIDWTVNDNLALYTSGGVFLPGAFYAIEVDRVAGDQLGGQANSWAVNAGTRVEF